MQWIYGLFLDLMSYCANALLGVMSTDLTFFEDSVPIVVDLYAIFVAVGWGLLIGNCAFQCIKAMFAGFGFETESPMILLLRTGLFGFLLIFSKDICEIGLSIGKNVITLLGLPSNITLSMPSDSMFGGLGASWLLVIIIGFILGFQLIKLFFEIAERYVVVAVLTLLCPVGLAMGGSKSTKEICIGFIRTYISMIVMMVMNVLFLKLILSALATMPSGALVLPWCLLVVGIAKTARKADNLISKIGLNAAATGDPLGAGRGLMMAAMVTRTIMSVAGKGGGSKAGGGKATGGSQTNSTSHYSSNRGGNVRNSTGGTNVGGNNIGGNNVGGTNVGGNSMAAGATYGATTESSATTQRTNQSSNMSGSRTTANTQSASNVRFGANSYGGTNNTAQTQSSIPGFNSSGKSHVNHNRFGNQPGTGKNNSGGNNTDVQNKPTGTTSQGKTTAQRGQTNVDSNNTTAKTSAKTVNGGTASATVQKSGKGVDPIKQTKKTKAQQATNNAKKTRFGGAQPTGTVRQNANPVGKPKTAMPNVGGVRTTPGSTKITAKPDNIETTDTAKEVLQDIAETITSPKDGENNGS
ncbi:MAG: hypothetical protein HFE65_04070 [Clostridiales bacterium]|nr:hypothetical protein [Clostridiales bacterium]